MEVFLAELVGTTLLVYLGTSVVANTLLSKTAGSGTGFLMITMGWGVAVALSVYTVGSISGAHINPAVTLGLAAIGECSWTKDVPVYLSAQMLGAMLGAVLMAATYKPHWGATDDANLKLACYSTSPAIHDPPWNFLTEFLGTFVLVFVVLAIGSNSSALGDYDVNLPKAFEWGVNPMLVGLLVLGIGMCLGGPTGYAINPARDLGPRIVHALLPIPGKRDSNWSYAWVPVLGPALGGIAGAVVFKSLGIFWATQP